MVALGGNGASVGIGITTANSTLQLLGPVATNYREYSGANSTVNVQETDSVLIITSTNVTITMLAAAGRTGRAITIGVKTGTTPPATASIASITVIDPMYTEHLITPVMSNPTTTFVSSTY